MSNELNEKIFRSVDTIVSARLQNLPFDQTIIGVVESVPEKLGTQKYIVNYKGAKLTVFVNDTDKKYAINEEVYILIPGGDFSAKKLITGRVISDYQADEKRNENNYLPSFSHWVSPEQEYSLIVENSNSESTKLIYEVALNDSPIIGYTTLQLAYNIAADLYNNEKIVDQGIYGLRVILTAIDQNTVNTNDNNLKQDLIYNMTCDNMLLMNKYRSGGYTAQNFNITITDKIITNIKIIAYHNGKFYDSDNNKITQKDDLYIKLKNFTLTTGYLKKDLDNDSNSDIAIYFYSLNGIQYKSNTNKLDVTTAFRPVNKVTGTIITYPITNVQLYRYNESNTTNTSGVGIGWDSITNVIKEDTILSFKLQSGDQITKAIYCIKVSFNVNNIPNVYAVSNKLTFTNQTSNENISLLAGITLTPNNNSNVFYSYGQDNQLLARSDSEKLQRIAVSFSSKDTTGNTTLVPGVNLTYYLPVKNTMILPVDSRREINKKNQQEYYTFNKKLTSDDLQSNIFYIPFKIANLYNPLFKNNTIICDVEINDQIYTQSLDLLFGVSGSSGANYVLQLELQDSASNSKVKSIFYKATNQPVYKIQYYLYDYAWNSIPNNDLKNISFTWYNSTLNNNSKIKLDNKTGVITLLQDLIAEDGIASKLIVQMTGTYQGIELKGYITIPVSFNPLCACIDGCSIITYDITGKKPIYEKTPYRLYQYSDSLDLQIIDDIEWNLIDESGLLKFNSIDPNGPNSKIKIITPPTIYSPQNKSSYITASLNGSIVWIQPILMINNTYPTAMWNDMRGNEINFNNNELQLFSATVGQLDAKQANGVLMGTFINNNNKKQEYGLYAFNDKNIVFKITDNGEAYIQQSEKAYCLSNKDENSTPYSVGSKTQPIYFDQGVPKQIDINLTNINNKISTLENTISNLQQTIQNLTDRVIALEKKK